MEKENSAWSMSCNYQSMVFSLKDWANESPLFVKGQVELFPEFISKDDMFSKLVESDPEINDSSIQCLEIIFNSFVVVSGKM